MPLLKFTQKEEIEIKQISPYLKVPMSFNQNQDNSIDFDFTNNKSVQSILKKSISGYRMDYTDSDGQSDYYSNADWAQFKRRLSQWVQKIKRENPIEFQEQATIKKLSKTFYPTYKEAIMILNLGSLNSAGMIFRKSLEIIVKDFLFYLLPESYHTNIYEQTIGRIIFDFYKKDGGELVIKDKFKSDPIKPNLEEIKSLAKMINNTFKIGNDFAHYERKLHNFTAENMRENIENIIFFIDSKLQEDKLRNIRAKLNDEFNTEGLI